MIWAGTAAGDVRCRLDPAEHAAGGPGRPKRRCVMRVISRHLSLQYPFTQDEGQKGPMKPPHTKVQCPCTKGQWWFLMLRRYPSGLLRPIPNPPTPQCARSGLNLQGRNPQADPTPGGFCFVVSASGTALRGAAVHPGSRPAPRSPDTSGHAMRRAGHRHVERQVLLSTTLARAL
jgi:hypothetical protein